jgi:hypothetical protein
VLYGIAAVRYGELYRRRRRPLPLAVLVAFILMAEAMIAVAFSRTWHAMWWEWHVLMAVAFGSILVAARVEYRREGSLGAVFAGIYLDSTLRRIDRNDAERLSEVVDAIRSGGPISQPSISTATRSTDRLGSSNWIRPHSSVATASPSPMIRKATTVPDPPGELRASVLRMPIRTPAVSRVVATGVGGVRRPAMTDPRC